MTRKPNQCPVCLCLTLACGRCVSDKCRIPQSTRDANQWREECAYISRVTDQRGNVAEMNHSAEVFRDYLRMQQEAATREGFHDAAEYIGHCLDDMESANR